MIIIRTFKTGLGPDQLLPLWEARGIGWNRRRGWSWVPQWNTYSKLSSECSQISYDDQAISRPKKSGTRSAVILEKSRMGKSLSDNVDRELTSTKTSVWFAWKPSTDIIQVNAATDITRVRDGFLAFMFRFSAEYRHRHVILPWGGKVWLNFSRIAQATSAWYRLYHE